MSWVPLIGGSLGAMIGGILSDRIAKVGSTLEAILFSYSGGRERGGGRGGSGSVFYFLRPDPCRRCAAWTHPRAPRGAQVKWCRPDACLKEGKNGGRISSMCSPPSPVSAACRGLVSTALPAMVQHAISFTSVGSAPRCVACIGLVGARLSESMAAVLPHTCGGQNAFFVSKLLCVLCRCCRPQRTTGRRGGCGWWWCQTRWRRRLPSASCSHRTPGASSASSWCRSSERCECGTRRRGDERAKKKNGPTPLACDEPHLVVRGYVGLETLQ